MQFVERIEALAAHKRSWLLFFATAAITFSPFLLRGHVIVSTTDSTYNHYPNILFGHRSLQEGDFGLWNPEIFCGFDFSSSFHHHMLHPRNWVLLLAPTKYVLHLLTLMMYLEVSLVGCFTFQIFRRYMDRPSSALFLAVVAQLCGFTWFTTATMIATHMLFASLAAIFVLVTMSERRPIANYVLLTLCFFDVLMIGHVAYIFAFSLPVIAVFLWQYGRPLVRRPWQAPIAPVLVAFASAVLLSLVRLVPILHGLVFEQIAVDRMAMFGTAPGAQYFVLTGFLPELFGVALHDSLAVGRHLGANGFHIQLNNLLYFGLAPSLLLWFGLLRGMGQRSFVFTLIWAAVATAPMLLVQLISDLLQVGVHPLGHVILYRVNGSFLFVVALAYCVRWLETNDCKLNDWKLPGAFVAGSFLLAFGITFWVRVAYDSRNQLGDSASHILWALRIAAVTAAGVGIWIAARVKFTELNVRRMTNAAIVAFAVVAAILGVIAKREGAFESWAIGQTFAFGLATAMWAVAVLFTVRGQDAASAQAFRRWLPSVLIGISLLILIVPWSYANGSRAALVIPLVSFLGMAKFVLLALVAVEIVVYCDSTRNRSLLIPLLCALTLGELLAHTKIYGHSGAVPFQKATALYAPRSFTSLISAASQGKQPVNLLRNDTLLGTPAPEGWNLGGASVSCDRDTQTGRFALVSQNGGATAYQDLQIPPDAEAVSLGCWVRCDRPNQAMVDLTCGHEGGPSVAHSGSGKWEWLSVTALRSPKVNQARPHLVCKDTGSAEFLGPMVSTKFVAVPQRTPDDPVEVTPALTLARSGEPNLKWYRVNHPCAFVRFTDNETLSSVAMVYGVPSYSGSDSDVKRRLWDLLEFYDPTIQWGSRAGVIGLLTEPKLLDVLGARYDYDASTHQMLVRPTALARLSLFESFETIPDRKELLARLKQDDFNHQTTVLLEKQPEIEPSSNPAAFRPVDFQSISTSELKTCVELEKPAILLFNDSYSPYWRCECNGTELPIIPANCNFMAVALPAGHCEVELAFRPLPVYRLAKLSAGMACIVFTAGCYTVATRRAQRSSVRRNESLVDEPLRRAA
jgi:hypothetical protein